jgi:hypothetical protein
LTEGPLIQLSQKTKYEIQISADGETVTLPWELFQLFVGETVAPVICEVRHHVESGDHSDDARRGAANKFKLTRPGLNRMGRQPFCLLFSSSPVLLSACSHDAAGKQRDTVLQFSRF